MGDKGFGFEFRIFPTPLGVLPGFWDQAFGIRITDFGIWMSGFRSEDPGLGCRGPGFGIRDLDVGVRVLGFGIWMSGFGVQGLGFGCRGSGLGVRGSDVGVRGLGCQNTAQPASGEIKLSLIQIGLFI